MSDLDDSVTRKEDFSHGITRQNLVDIDTGKVVDVIEQDQADPDKDVKNAVLQTFQAPDEDELAMEQAKKARAQRIKVNIEKRKTGASTSRNSMGASKESLPQRKMTSKIKIKGATPTQAKMIKHKKSSSTAALQYNARTVQQFRSAIDLTQEHQYRSVFMQSQSPEPAVRKSMGLTGYQRPLQRNQTTVKKPEMANMMRPDSQAAFQRRATTPANMAYASERLHLETTETARRKKTKKAQVDKLPGWRPGGKATDRKYDEDEGDVNLRRLGSFARPMTTRNRTQKLLKTAASIFDPVAEENVPENRDIPNFYDGVNGRQSANIDEEGDGGITDRLFNEAKQIEKIKEGWEKIREAQETVECTFVPKISQAEKDKIIESRVRSSFITVPTSTKRKTTAKRSFTTKRLKTAKNYKSYKDIVNIRTEEAQPVIEQADEAREALTARTAKQQNIHDYLYSGSEVKSKRIKVFEKEKEAQDMQECSFAPKITRKVPESSKFINQDALEARDAIDVDAVFQYHWNKMFNYEVDCKQEECKKFVQICVDEIGIRSDKKDAFDEQQYTLKLANLKDFEKPKKTEVYGIVCEMTGKGTKRTMKHKDYEVVKDKKKPIHERLNVKKSDVQAAREKRKEIKDMQYPYKPQINKVIPDFQLHTPTLTQVINKQQAKNALKNAERIAEEEKAKNEMTTLSRTDRLYLMHEQKLKKIKQNEQIKAIMEMKDVTFQPNIEKKMKLAAEKIEISQKVHQKIMTSLTGASMKQNLKGLFSNTNRRLVQEDIDEPDFFITTSKKNPMGIGKVRRGKDKRAKKRVQEPTAPNEDLVVVAADNEVQAITSPTNDQDMAAPHVEQSTQQKSVISGELRQQLDYAKQLVANARSIKRSNYFDEAAEDQRIHWQSEISAQKEQELDKRAMRIHKSNKNENALFGFKPHEVIKASDVVDFDLRQQLDDAKMQANALKRTDTDVLRSQVAAEMDSPDYTPTKAKVIADDSPSLHRRKKSITNEAIAEQSNEEDAKQPRRVTLTEMGKVTDML